MNATTRRRRKRQRMPKRGGKQGMEENQSRPSRKRKWEQRNNDLAEEKEEEEEENDSEEAEAEWEKGNSGRMDEQPFDVGATMEDFAYQELLHRQGRMGQGSSSSRPNRELRIQEIHADNETPIESMPISIRAGIAARKSGLPKHLRLRTESVLANKDPNERERIVASGFNVDIKQHHIVGLCPGEWLNDELINFYFQLLHQYDRQLAALDPTRVLSVFASSFYFSKLVENGVYDYGRVARWNKNQRFFQSQYVFFPVNINNAHWVLVVADVPQHTLTLYDSLPGMVRWSRVLPFLVNALEERYRQEHEGREDPTPWRLFTYHGINQENGNDCGLYTIMTANLLVAGLPVARCTLSPDCAAKYRNRVASQILEVDLGYPFFNKERKVISAPPVPPLAPIVPFLPPKRGTSNSDSSEEEVNLISDSEDEGDGTEA